MDLLSRLAEALAAGLPVAMATIVEAPGQPALVGLRLLADAGQILADEVGAVSAGDEPGGGPLGGGPMAGEPGGGGSQGAHASSAAIAALCAEVLAAGKARTVHLGEVRVYLEPYLPVPRLVVTGAGHVAQPMARVGKLLGFHVTVIDDRPDYANRDRFPDADAILCEPFLPALRSLGLGPSHYVVLVTRGHQHDQACLREVAGLDLAYLGMIGSRNRVRTVCRALAEEGIPAGRLARIYAPIGLDIGAQTPGEIAVAVGAELVKVRRGGTGESLSRNGGDPG